MADRGDASSASDNCHQGNEQTNLQNRQRPAHRDRRDRTHHHARAATRLATGAVLGTVILAASLLSPQPAHQNAAPPWFVGLPTAAAQCPPDCGGNGGGDYGPPGGGQQFQPPSMGGQQPGYSGGINSGYPGLDPSNGISINNPAAQAPTGQQGGNAQYPQQAQPRTPAHGQMPPNYDAPPQQPAQPPSQQPVQQQPQQPAQQQEPQQQADNNQDTQKVNQRQQQCQDAAAMLGNTLVGISGGGGRGPIWIEPRLDPTPPCPQCEPQTAQKDSGQDQQPSKSVEERLQDLEESQKKLEQENQDLKDQNQKLKKKCTGFEKFVGLGQLALGVGGMFVAVGGAGFTGGQSLWGAAPAFFATADAWNKLNECNDK